MSGNLFLSYCADKEQKNFDFFTRNTIFAPDFRHNGAQWRVVRRFFRGWAHLIPGVE